jgi:hypothetical protein
MKTFVFFHAYKFKSKGNLNRFSYYQILLQYKIWYTYLFIISSRKNYQQLLQVLLLVKIQTRVTKNVYFEDFLNNIIIINQTIKLIIPIQLFIVTVLVVTQIHFLPQHVLEVEHQLPLYH